MNGFLRLWTAITFGTILLVACDSQSGLAHEEFAQVCQGHGIAEAAAYDGGPGPHPMVLISSSGEQHPWRDSLPDTWMATEVNETELVVCIGEEIQGGPCHSCLCSLPFGLPFPDIARYAYQLPVWIVAAQTGRLVTMGSLRSTPPPLTCPDDCYSVGGQLGGAYYVTSGQLEEWLERAVERGEVLRTLESVTGYTWPSALVADPSLLSVAFSPDGEMLAAGSYDGTIFLWDVRTGERLRTLEEHPVEVWSVAFSPDGRTLASGSEDGAVTMWDAQTGEHLRTLLGHPDGVRSVVFSPDGRWLASGSRDGTVVLWDAATGEAFDTLCGPTVGHGVSSLAFNPSGSRLAIGRADGTTQLQDPRTGSVIRTLAGHGVAVASVAFSPDGRMLVAGMEDSTATMWNATTGIPIYMLRYPPGYATSVAFNPDGQTVAISDDDTIILWDSASGHRLRTLQGYSHGVFSLAFSPDGSVLASSTWDGTVILWDAAP